MVNPNGEAWRNELYYNLSMRYVNTLWLLGSCLGYPLDVCDISVSDLYLLLVYKTYLCFSLDVFRTNYWGMKYLESIFFVLRLYQRCDNVTFVTVCQCSVYLLGNWDICPCVTAVLGYLMLSIDWCTHTNGVVIQEIRLFL